MFRARTRRIAAVAASALALAGAFAAGRFVARDDEAGASSSDSPVVERPPFERGDPNAPPWSPTGGWVLPVVGSLFRQRFATADSPLDGMEAVLVTPRKEECLDDCPLTLRVVGGEAGSKTLAKVLPSLDPDLRRLFSARGMPTALSDQFRVAEAELAEDAARGRVDGARPPTRGLFIGMPRPDVGPTAWSVGLVVTDLPDPHFDPPRAGDFREEGRCLFVARVETNDARGKPRVLMGAVAVGRSVGRPSRVIPAGAGAVGAAFGSLWGHFGTIADDISGLYMDANGRIWGFGSDLRLRPVAESPVLRGALLAVLRRA